MSHVRSGTRLALLTPASGPDSTRPHLRRDPPAPPAPSPGPEISALPRAAPRRRPAPAPSGARAAGRSSRRRPGRGRAGSTRRARRARYGKRRRGLGNLKVTLALAVIAAVLPAGRALSARTGRTGLVTPALSPAVVGAGVPGAKVAGTAVTLAGSPASNWSKPASQERKLPEAAVVSCPVSSNTGTASVGGPRRTGSRCRQTRARPS